MGCGFLGAELLEPKLNICASPKKRFGATATSNSSDGKAAEQVIRLTKGRGVDTAIEAVGIPDTFVLCEDIVASGGVIANIGVHGVTVALHLDRLWSQNVTITTRLVDTASTPTLLKTVQCGRLDPKQLIMLHFKLNQILQAGETFWKPAATNALKVIIEALCACAIGVGRFRTSKTRMLKRNADFHERWELKR